MAPKPTSLERRQHRSQRDNSTDYTDWHGPTRMRKVWISWIGLEKNWWVLCLQQWQYNGTYIKNFNLIVDIDDPALEPSASPRRKGITMQMGSKLPYHMDVTVHGLVNGTQRTTFRAIACGDGGGRSTE